jgi:hypothetical protein
MQPRFTIPSIFPFIYISLIIAGILTVGFPDRAFSGQILPQQDSCDCLKKNFGVPQIGKGQKESTMVRKLLSHSLQKNDGMTQPRITDTLFTNIPNPSGICSGGNSFWVPNYSAAGGNMEIYKLDIRARRVVDSIPAPDEWTTGMAWDGSNLWVTGMDYLLPLPWSCLTRMSVTGEILDHYSSDYSCFWAGIAWDGTYLYYGTNTCGVTESRQTSMIFKVTHDNVTIIDSIAPPSGNINGLVYDRGYFWYCDLLTEMIYKITASGNIVTSFPSPGAYPSGLAIAQGYLWNIDLQTGCIYQIDIGLAPPIPQSLAVSTFNHTSELSWAVNSTSELTKYKIYRATTDDPVQAICIDSVSSLQFSYTDHQIVRGVMWYWVSAVDSAGYESHLSKPVFIQILPLLPTNFTLDQNFPNPFNSATDIRFGLPVSSSISLILYDVLGKEVTILASGSFPAGEYTYSWDGSKISSGVYFYRLRAGMFDKTKKLLMEK